MKTTLQPGEKFGPSTIPQDMFIELSGEETQEEKMKIFNILTILSSEYTPNIMCSCENKQFLWLFEAHRRFQQKNEEQAFVFKVQITCKRCQRPKTFDIGPTKECYETLLRNRASGLRKWAMEIETTINNHFKKSH